jgi:hypothetical protein
MKAIGGARRLGAVIGADDVGMAQTSPSSHGKLSQHAVAQDSRIVFAIARKRNDAPGENFSFFSSMIGQVQVAAHQVQGDPHRLDIIRSEPPVFRKPRNAHCLSLESKKRGLNRPSPSFAKAPGHRDVLMSAK